MTLPEYKNLTPKELEAADHYAEIGDVFTLRAYQRLSACRDQRPLLDLDAYAQPLKPVKKP